METSEKSKTRRPSKARNWKPVGLSQGVGFMDLQLYGFGFRV